MTISLEICVDDLRGLQIANDADVDRIELCSALDQGGLTPTPELISQARQADVPIYAMIRPRGGNFVYDAPEIDAMVAAIQTMKSAGFAGVVFGALTPQHTLDLNAMQRLCHAARGMDITLHRAVDVSANPVDCVEIANNLGISRILTSGGAPTAPEGVETLRKMIAAAGRTVDIMAGSGVTHETVTGLLQAGLQHVHASCRVPCASCEKPHISQIAVDHLKQVIAQFKSDQGKDLGN